MLRDYGVRVIRAYQQFSVGHVLYPPGMLREQLLRGGFVEPVKPVPDDDGKAERRKPGRRAP